MCSVSCSVDVLGTFCCVYMYDDQSSAQLPQVSFQSVRKVALHYLEKSLVLYIRFRRRFHVRTF